MGPISNLLVFSIILSSCFVDNEKSELIQFNKSKEKMPSIQRINEWQKDSIGCLGHRTLILAQEMVEEHKLLGKTKEEFIKYFGKSNSVTRKEQHTFLDYYTEVRCNDNGTIDQEADKCWIQFVFKKNRLEKIPEVFACE